MIATWHRFTLSPPDADTAAASFEILLSPEVADFLSCGDSDLVRAKKTRRKKISRPLLVKVCPKVRKNCVVADGNLFPGAAFVYLCLSEYSSLLPLSSVRLTVREEYTKAIFAAASKKLQDLAESGAKLPLAEGAGLKVSEELKFDSVRLEPADEGWWTSETEIYLDYVGESGFKKLAKFAAEIVGLRSASEALSDSAFMFNVKECTTKFAKFVANEAAEEEEDIVNLSLTLLLSSNGGKWIGKRFCQVVLEGGRTLMLQCILSPLVSSIGGGSIALATPCLLRQLDSYAGIRDDQRKIKIWLLSDEAQTKVHAAKSATVAHLPCSAFHRLSTAEMDAVVAKYLSVAKYVLCGSVVEIPLHDVLEDSHPELRRGSEDDTGSIFLQVLKLEGQTGMTAATC